MLAIIIQFFAQFKKIIIGAILFLGSLGIARHLGAKKQEKKQIEEIEKYENKELRDSLQIERNIHKLSDRDVDDILSNKSN